MPELGFAVSATTLRRFWTMVAHYHANISLGSSESTMRLLVIYPGELAYALVDSVHAVPLASIHDPGTAARFGTKRKTAHR